MAECSAETLHQRDHAFEVGGVLGVRAALSADSRVRPQIVTHGLERRGHLGDESAGELQLASFDRDLGISLGFGPKAAGEVRCRLWERERRTTSGTARLTFRHSAMTSPSFDARSSEWTRRTSSAVHSSGYFCA